jgi:hypothetical protein
MGRRAARRDGVAQGLGLRGRDEIRNRCDPRLGIGAHDDRAAHHFADRHQVGERIVVEPHQMYVDRDRAVREDDEGMAVRIAAHQGVDADGGICPGLVFHDDGLSDAVLQVPGDDACGQINAATGWIGHDDPDGLARERLRLRRCGDGDDRAQRDQPPLHVKDAHDEYSPSPSSGPRPMMSRTRWKVQAHHGQKGGRGRSARRKSVAA